MRFGYKHELSAMSDDQVGAYLKAKLKNISIEEFLVGMSANDSDNAESQED